ncbi:MAG TPA: DNA polymerase III subunit gamma/tau [Burkholderiales bacterium]|jgi:DNA polymerase-3 subunit gamma/tau|nr:DNA polymerase III subunit gamma/tau [Burkholderiales bacterium]
MSYQVLARKWRPRDFGSLVGQEHVVRALRHALEQKRLHHAYLFTGTRGVGKTTLARILAKCLNCETGITPQPCGKCSACIEIDGGRFVDLLEVDAATNTKVDEMRQLLETAQYAPTRGRFKVYVIDEVHMLSSSAFNAMLKTLEEPPEHMKFILATTDPQKIPVTVLSRCLQFNLKQMPPAAIVSHLERILGDEKVEFEKEALSLIARAAAGSMRDALSLLDQAIAHGGGRVAAAAVGEMLGAIDQSYLVRLLECVAGDDAPGAVAVAGEMQSRSLSFDAALADLASLLLRMALAQSVPGALDELAEPERLAALAGKLDPESLQLYYQIALQGREDLPLAPDEHGGFLMTVLRMLAFRPEGAADTEPAKPQAAKPLAKPKAASSSSSLSREWPQLVRELAVTGAARELARNAELQRQENGVYDLVVPKAKAYLADRAYVDKLKAALDQHLGTAVRLNVSVGEVAGASAAALEANEREARRAEALKSVQGDGFVQDLVNIFEAKVVDSSIRERDK